jgi:NADH dehydrogenase
VRMLKPTPGAHVPAAVANPDGARPRVVIVGAGFGGLEAARQLEKLPVDVVLIDRHNYHLFTPLLYQVATAGLEPEDIAHPVRGILRGFRTTSFLVANVERIDCGGRAVVTDAGELPYDYLVVAAGSTNNFFGIKSLARGAIGLKDVAEAVALRDRILTRFESAAWERDPERRASLLTFVVAGGGPTGVEFAGALHELVSTVLPKDYPRLDFTQVRVILVEASGQLLTMLDRKLQRAALGELRRKGVEVRLDTAVTQLDGDRLLLKDCSEIHTGTVIWAAGVRAAELADALEAEQGKQHRLKVEETLQLPGHPEVFVIGDMAAFEQGGSLLPMVAPVAIQGAQHAARSIDALMQGRQPSRFHYRDRGTMATIGRKAAVAQIGPLKLTGFIAWLAWLGLHLVTLIGFRNRLLVLVNWAWDYFFYDRAVRLILGGAHPPPQTDPATPDPATQEHDG